MISRLHRHTRRRGFSLLEMMITLGVSMLMLNFVLGTMQATNPMAPGECVNDARFKLNYIRAQIEAFARRNDRLPLPAARNIGVDSVVYGRESSGADIDAAGGVSFGALPWQALGLPSDYAGDCWGNKFTYMVTTALTTNASSGGYLDNTVVGNITLKKAAAVDINTAIAYAVISHGEDGLGAVKLNYRAANAGGTPDTAHRWCSGSTNIAYTNCLATAATVMDAPFNNGKNAGTAYFDDIVMAAKRPVVFTSALSNLYCWGDNTYGRLGDGTTTASAYPTISNLPSGQSFYAQVTSGETHTCALTSTGLPYCWGRNNAGQLGNGTNTDSSTPVASTLPSGVTYFKTIRSAFQTTCGIGSNDRAYCWGLGGNGQTGIGGWGNYNVPTIVPLPGGAASFTDISLGYVHTCAIVNTGDVYCTGDNTYGKTGDNVTGGNSFTLVTRPGGVSAFVKVSAGWHHTCALADTGNLYCWGYSTYGAFDGTTGSNTYNTPQLVTNPGGVNYFTDITAGRSQTCAIGDDGEAYCAGGSFTNVGQIGDGFNTNRTALTKVTRPSGVTSWNNIYAQYDSTTVCAAADNFKTYCWGNNAANEVGDGGTTNRNVPTLVTDSGATIQFGTAGTGRCALKPLPPAAWGYGLSGQIGDGASVHRATPTYVTMPSGVNYFKSATLGGNLCAISDTGAGYCAGANTTGPGNIGDGSTASNKSTLTAVTMPVGRTFVSMHTGNYYGNCAIADNAYPYCWGSGYYIRRGTSSTIPALEYPASNTVTQINMYGYGLEMVGSDGIPYGGSEAWSNPVARTLPGGVTSAKDAVGGSSTYVWCIRGNDDQLYCAGTSGGSSRRGDGSTSGYDGTYQPVAPGTTFKALTAGLIGGGAIAPCAIGTDNELYFWGCYNSSCGTLYSVPTLLTRPTGVGGWKSLSSTHNIVTVQSTGGVWYYFRMFDNSGAGSNVDLTKLPLPPGASGWRSVDGRAGIPY